MSGVPIVIAAAESQPPDCEYYLMITYGHRTEAIYRAAEREPDNPHIIATIQDGLYNCIELLFKTPKDIRQYLKRFANSFNQQGLHLTN